MERDRDDVGPSRSDAVAGAESDGVPGERVGEAVGLEVRPVGVSVGVRMGTCLVADDVRFERDEVGVPTLGVLSLNESDEVDVADGLDDAVGGREWESVVVEDPL